MKLFTTAAVMVFGALPLLAQAYEKGDYIVRVGAASVQPDDSSAGIAVPAIGQSAIDGTSATVDGDTQLGLTISYMFSDVVGMELLAATPFSHRIQADLRAAGFGVVDAAETKQLPPTLSFVYYPWGSSQNVKPYVGLGLNYTVFFDESVHGDLEGAAPAVVNAITGEATLPNLPVAMALELDDSWGLALQVGADLLLNEQWILNTSVCWIDINTEARFTSALGDTITVNDVEIDPWVYQINVGFHF